MFIRLLLIALFAHVISAQALPSNAWKKIFGSASSIVDRSIHVVRLRDGATLYQDHADQTVTPASVSKLITAAAALDSLTPAFEFTTSLYATGPLKSGVISGDLVIVGDGDPYLVSEKVWQLAIDLKNMGLKSVNGDLIIDDRLFDKEVRDESRMAGKRFSKRAYDAPVSAFGINFNTFAVMVAPGDRVGQAAKIALDPYPLSGVRLQGVVQTKNGNRNSGVKVSRRLDAKTQTEELTVSGTIGVAAAPAKIYRSVSDHETATGEYVRAFLQAQGILISGKTRLGPIPATAKKLYDLEGYPMQKVITGLNKYSNNYIADVLIKRMGAKFPKDGRQPDEPRTGTYENGIAVVNRFLKEKVGIKSQFVLKNGSGLSTDNRLSSRQITKLLQYMETRADIFPEFLASLPASGRDGTLKKRFDVMSTQSAIGKVRAKTGTLTQPVTVSSLAGYLRHPQHGWIAFAIMQNGKSRKRQPSVLDLRAQQDKAVTQMLKAL